MTTNSDETPEGVDIANPGAAEAGEGNSEQTTKDPHLEKAIAERDKAKARARDAEAKLAEIEAAKVAAEDAKAKAEGRWEDLIAKRDEEIEKYRSQIAERDQQAAQLRAGLVERDILDGISQHAKADKALVRAAYRDLAQSEGWDSDPKDLDKAISKRLEAMQGRYKSLFESKPKPTAGSPPTRSTAKSGPMILG